MKLTKSMLIKLIVVCLVLSLFLPTTAMAADDSITPYASYYLNAYNTYICDLGNGQIQIWYEVAGTRIMDEVGVLSIELYEVKSDGSLSWIKTFQHEDYSSMLAYDTDYTFSHVSYSGSSSKTYKAYVCIWAGKNGSGDTRYMWATE